MGRNERFLYTTVHYYSALSIKITFGNNNTTCYKSKGQMSVKLEKFRVQGMEDTVI